MGDVEGGTCGFGLTVAMICRAKFLLFANNQ